MFLIAFFTNPFLWAGLWILQAAAYYSLLKRLGLRTKLAFVPFLAEWELSGILFLNRRVFWQSLIVSLAALASGLYFDGRTILSFASSQNAIAFLFGLLAFAVYGCFVIRLYWRLCRMFGKKFFFFIGMLVLPPLLLYLLSRSKTSIQGPSFRISANTPVQKRIFRDCALTCLHLLVCGGLAGAIYYGATLDYTPRYMVNISIADAYRLTSGIRPERTVPDREAMMEGDEYNLNDYAPSRDYFFPDHSKDASVVVMEYLIGSDLEAVSGVGSVNLRQMIDATRQGSALTFVVEAGGSQRWFTDGIEDASVGRYAVHDGRLKKVKDCPPETSMSDGAEIRDFITWTKENYPADRYILMFWDHGGGFSGGYGVDCLNYDEGAVPVSTPDLIGAVKDSGVLFDLIGFDACLMQDIEMAVSLEPYADYYLASEESVSSNGLYYTAGFGRLAANPGLSTEELAADLISTFDVYNEKCQGETDNSSTLSLIDLTRIRPAFDRLMEFYELENDAILADPENFARVSQAAGDAYYFSNQYLDLIDYLEKLDQADADEAIIMDADMRDLIHSIRAAIVFRNADSYYGINGLAFTFPYRSMVNYTGTYETYKALDMKEPQTFYNDFFSILASRHNEESQEKEYLQETFADYDIDVTQEEWYVSGFENYRSGEWLIDIPLEEKENGWAAALTDEMWNTIVDNRQVFYQRTDDGLRYLGCDYVGNLDEKGHLMASTDGTWIHVNGETACFETGQVYEGNEGTVYTGTIPALLNGSEDIILSIVYDPVPSGSQEAPKAHVEGYWRAADANAYMEKGLRQLKPGDTLQFEFIYIDEETGESELRPAGSTIRVSKADALEVESAPLGPCELSYGLVMQDVYQRVLESQLINSTIE